jgi:hypothetical protein
MAPRWRPTFRETLAPASFLLQGAQRGGRVRAPPSRRRRRRQPAHRRGFVCPPSTRTGRPIPSLRGRSMHLPGPTCPASRRGCSRSNGPHDPLDERLPSGCAERLPRRDGPLQELRRRDGRWPAARRRSRGGRALRHASAAQARPLLDHLGRSPCPALVAPTGRMPDAGLDATRLRARATSRRWNAPLEDLKAEGSSDSGIAGGTWPTRGKRRKGCAKARARWTS